MFPEMWVKLQHLLKYLNKTFLRLREFFTEINRILIIILLAKLLRVFIGDETHVKVWLFSEQC